MAASAEGSLLLNEYRSFARIQPVTDQYNDGLAVLQVPSLRFDAEEERFVGAHAYVANGLLTRRYRPPFVLP